MKNLSNAFNGAEISTQARVNYFINKLACETDCSDVYQDIKNDSKNYLLLDVRAQQAYLKSHAVTAINIPHSEINAQRFEQYTKDTLFVVYCWGPGCNGATKAAAKIAALGFRVKEMLGGIHYWEDFERYPVERHVEKAQQ